MPGKRTINKHHNLAKSPDKAQHRPFVRGLCLTPKGVSSVIVEREPFLCVVKKGESMQAYSNDVLVSPRNHWTSRWAFILVTAGSAVGLGNIWRFPYMTGTQGGSAFVLVYLICLLAVGLSLLIAEVVLGRRGRADGVSSFANVAKDSKVHALWGKIGWVGVLSVFCILSFYTVVGGWIMEYMVRASAGFEGITAEQAKAGFTDLLASPVTLIFWHTVFVAMTGGVVIFGVTSGIERANRFMMPALFFILLGILVYAIFSADMPSALKFMFQFSPEKIDRSVILSALGQAFFTLGLGNGTMIVYGSYLKPEIDIARSALYVVVIDTLIAVMASLAIFAIVFAQNLPPEAGPGLLLGTLPLAFAAMPAGHLVGFAFFILVVFAAWTSAISICETLSAVLIERFKLTRKRAVVLVSVSSWLVGLGACLSFNHWSEFKILGLGIFDFLDSLSSKVLMPMSGLLIAIFCGWVAKRELLQSELKLTQTIYRAWEWAMKWLVPLAIIAIFLNAFIAEQ